MRFGPCHAPLEAKHLAAAATRTTTASRPLLENQMKVKHAAPAALLDPTRAHTRRSLKAAHASDPAAATRARSSTPKPRQWPPQAQHGAGCRLTLSQPDITLGCRPAAAGAS